MKFNLNFTTTKLMAYLLFILLLIAVIGMIIIKDFSHLTSVSATIVGAIMVLLSVKNLTQKDGKNEIV